MTRMRKSILWVLVGMVFSLLALTLLGGQALAQETPREPVVPVSNMGSDHYGLNWNVVGAGGGMSSSAHFTLNSTMGQPTVGTTTSTHYEACAGYWCWLDRLAGIFLPLISK